VIDTHCHLLSRIDDGPRSAIETIDLARVLVAQGVRAALCTPHYSSRFPTRLEAARARFDELQRDLAELRIPLHVELAAEVDFRIALSVPLEELQGRSVAGFVLVELDADATADVPARVVDRLKGAQLKAIFAHPERSRELSADPLPLEEARASGALVQVVGSSLLRRRGHAASAAGWALLDDGHADLLATDSHGAAGTAAHLRELLDVATQRYGSGAVDELTAVNPSRVLGAQLASRS
jgi:protein-tyrosine phosphatase